MTHLAVTVVTHLPNLVMSGRPDVGNWERVRVTYSAISWEMRLEIWWKRA